MSFTLESAAGGRFAGHPSAVKSSGRSVADFKGCETHIEDGWVTLCQYESEPTGAQTTCHLHSPHSHRSERSGPQRCDQVLPKALLINRKIQAAWSKGERGDEKQEKRDF